MGDILIKILVCFIAGAGAGIGTGFAGMSAAAVIGPMLITFLGVPAYDAIGIGLISDVLASLVSAYTYKKSGNLDVKNSLPLLVSVLVVTMIGSFVASLLPEQAMSGTMQIALIIIGLRFLLKPVNKTREQLEESSPKSRLIKAIVGGIFVGFICGFAAVFACSNLGSVKSNLAKGYDLEAISMCVLGGISTAGGKGTMAGAIIAIFIIGLLRYGLGLINLSGQTIRIILGALLIAVVLYPTIQDAIKNRIRAKK